MARAAPADRSDTVMQRAHLLRQLVLDSQYVIDEHVVAAAILTRAATRSLVGEATFRNQIGRPQIRSFRPSTQVRSFRPCGLRVAPDARRSSRQRRLG
jgi:hypothetical protein